MTRKRRDPRKISEDALHESIVSLLRFKGHPDLIWYHCPNGIPANSTVGARFLKLGMRAGVADLCLVLPDRTAAFLEFKSQTGRWSLAQKVFAGQCRKIGVPYEVVRTWEDAERVLSAWGALRVAPVARAA